MFTHLHVHSSYSLMDGIQPAEEIGPTIAERGMKSVALTDHGYMGGIPKFVKGCREAGVKPIIGNETYMAFGDAKHHKDIPLGEKSTDVNGEENKLQNNGHFLLLAKNATGYRNLTKLTQYSYEHGFHRFPRIDLDTFCDNAEGLMVTTTCMSSQMAKLWRRDMKKEAGIWIERVMEAVGRENFFFEVQVNNYDHQNLYNQQWMLPLSLKYDIPLILTADAHQQNQDEWKLRGEVQCIGWKQVPHKTKYEIKDYNAWMYDENFAKKLCQQWNIPEEAIHNTQLLADQVDGNYYESIIEAPEVSIGGHSNEETAYILRKRALAGLIENLKVDSWRDVPKEYLDRLKYELDLIEEARYSAYFLTVEDYIKLARENDIPVGPARGSSGGSLLAWSLSITGPQMDPIKNGLYFERFLNPGRINIDLDFSGDLQC